MNEHGGNTTDNVGRRRKKILKGIDTDVKIDVSEKGCL